MAENEERDGLQHLEALEAKAERQEEALEETLQDIREEVHEIEAHAHEPFLITVNNKPVKMVGHKHTGLEIKQAAINEGVRIQLDFVLSEELEHGRSRIIGDDEDIHVKSGACFEAIPNDDHS